MSEPGTERELTNPVDLCDPGGRLNPAARGWSRVPLHRCNLSRAWGRKKRWDFWGITSPDLFVNVTYADIDYLGTLSVWVHEPSTGFTVAVERIVPFGRGIALPEQPCIGHMLADVKGLRIDIDERDPSATRVQVHASGLPEGELDIDVSVAKPPGHQSTNVVIPWSAKRFQFTSKHNTRPATGTVRVGERAWQLDEDAWGTLDLGRGVWPYRINWNWAAGSGTNAAGQAVGLQFGGKWTVGTGHTENGLVVDGQLTKVSDELEWSYSWDDPDGPWRVVDRVGGMVDATLTPVHVKRTDVNAGVLAMRVRQAFGSWAGWLVTEHGEQVEFDGLIGWAEEARNRW